MNEPGTDCPTCERRIPYPKTESSPKDTKQLNLGEGPVDAVNEMKTRLDDLADKAGLTRLRFPRMKTLDLLLTLGASVSEETMLDAASQIGAERGWTT